jgi:hypothetical protein
VAENSKPTSRGAAEKKDDGVAYLLDHIVDLHSNGAHQILTQLHLYLTAERVNHGQSHSSQGHDSHFGIAASYRTTYRLAHHMSGAYVATFPERLNEMLEASPAISGRLAAARTLQRWRRARVLEASPRTVAALAFAAWKLTRGVLARVIDAPAHARVLYASVPAHLAQAVAARRVTRWATAIIIKHDNYVSDTNKSARHIKASKNLRAVSTATGTICEPYENEIVPPCEREVPINAAYDNSPMRTFWEESGARCVLQCKHESEFPCALDVTKIGLVSRADVGPPNRSAHKLHDNKILPQIEMSSSSLKDHVLKFLLRYKEWTDGRIFDAICFWCMDTEFVLYNALTLEI